MVIVLATIRGIHVHVWYVLLKLINYSSSENKENHKYEGGLDTWSHRFWHFYFSIFPDSLFELRRYNIIKHLRECFISYPNTSNFVKNAPLHIVLSILFWVLAYPNETLLSPLFDIWKTSPGLYRVSLYSTVILYQESKDVLDVKEQSQFP